MRTKKKSNIMVDIGNIESVFELKHQNGMKLVSYGCMGYKFKECLKNDFVYNIEFHSSKDKEFYQKMNKENWELVCRVDDWNYFRKPQNNIEFKNNKFEDVSCFIRLSKDNLFISFWIMFIIIFYMIYANGIGNIWSWILCSVLALIDLTFLFTTLNKFLHIKRLIFYSNYHI